MNRELKPLDRVREAELGLIAEPYHATRDLVTARQHRSLIRNLEDWWDRCLQGLDRRDGRSKELAWERLCARVMEGELVLVHNQSYPPPRPAFQQVDGVWSVAPYISSHRGGFRFKNRLFALDLERRERERWAQKQAASASGPEGLPTEPAVIKPATLGPHVGQGQKDCIGDPKYTNLQSMDPEYVGEETGKVWGTKVRYLNKTERQEFKLTIKDGRLFDSTGKPFDTTEASSVFAGGKGNAIFVMDEYGNIYASKIQSVGKFHHSSFLSGKPVASAGEITVKNGCVEGVTRRSGHYQPTQEQLNQFLAQLRTSGINLEQVNIQAGF